MTYTEEQERMKEKLSVGVWMTILDDIQNLRSAFCMDENDKHYFENPSNREEKAYVPVWLSEMIEAAMDGAYSVLNRVAQQKIQLTAIK